MLEKMARYGDPFNNPGWPTPPVFDDNNNVQLAGLYNLIRANFMADLGAVAAGRFHN